MEKAGFVYIMASGRNGTIYIGVTSDLSKRIWEHRSGVIGGFTKKHHCHRLVWYEAHESIEAARHRELQMKEWKRAWKLREIEGLKPGVGRPVRSYRVAMTAIATGPRPSPGHEHRPI